MPLMADGSSAGQNYGDCDHHGSRADGQDEEQLVARLTSMQQPLATSEIPEEPIAKFDYLRKRTMLYTARFLADGSCLEEALSYSDQAKAYIPSQIEDSLFSDPAGKGFGDVYISLRFFAWHENKNPANARQLLDATEWKLEVAPASRNPTDTGMLVLGQAGIYEQTKNPEELARAIQNCRDFLAEVEEFQDSAVDPQDLAEEELPRHRELYPLVLSTFSQLLYHEFRSSGKYALLELGMTIGHAVFIDIPETERTDLAMSLTHASIAHSFYPKIWDVPRSEQQVCDWSFVDENEEPDTVTEMTSLHLDLSQALYDKFELASDNSQIRLLRLKAGANDDPVTCLLEVVDLEGCPRYDALSYVWGDPRATESIILHGRKQDVTKNLYDALKQLRKPDKPRRFWIDALCIDQNNTKEKEGQIGLMDKIYSRANEVCMWLGEPTRTIVFSDDLRKIPCHVAGAEMLEMVFPTIYPQIKPHLSILDEGEFEKISSADPRDLQPILYRLPFSMRPIPSAPDRAILSGSAPALDMKNTSGETAILIQMTSNMNLCTDFEEVLSRNAWHQEATKETPASFNWGNEAQIPWYLESKLSGVDWPICGAFLLLNLLAMDVHFHDMPFFTSKGFSCMNGATAQAWNKSCFALYQILTSKYWSRAWILQEIVLAKNPRLYFGRHILPYPRFIRAMKNFYHHYQDCCKDVVPSSMASACEPQNWWMKLHEAFRTWIEGTSTMWANRQAKESQGKDASLPVTNVMVSNFKTRGATEPPDLIFSMLGLIKNDGPDAIPVDYSMAVEEVFARATSRALSESKNYLTLFSFAGYGRSEKLKYKLPSWCWDLTAPVEWGGPYAEISFHFDAFPDVAGDARMEKDLCLLITSAKVDMVAKVSLTSQCCAHNSCDDQIHNIHQWRECASLPKDTRNITINDTETKFWSTILGGCLPPSDSTLQSAPSAFLRITNADLQLIPPWQDWLCDPSRNLDVSMFGSDYVSSNVVDVRWLMKKEEFSRFNRRLHSAMLNKRFLVTEKGRLGVGPGCKDLEHFTRVEEGDEVHLMAGCRVPMILRPIGKVKGGGPKNGNDPAAFCADLKTCVHDEGLVCQLVGPCYVDGIMDGEAAKEDGCTPRKIYLR